MIRFPKYVTGSGLPTSDGEGAVWVVRLRAPFIMASMEPMGILGLRAYGWPMAAQTATSPAKLHSTMRQLASIWCREVDEMPGLPERWDYVFDPATVPPRRLVIDNHSSQWSGILDTEHLWLWHLDEATGEVVFPGINIGSDRPPIHVDYDDVVAWYDAYCAAEDAAG